MIRLPGWRDRFARFVSAAPRRAFDWRSWNCGIFVGGGIESVTGEDPHAPFAGRYEDEAGARALLASEGYSDMAELAAARLPEISPVRLAVADVAAIAVPGGFSLGLVIGDRIAVLHPLGYATVPLRQAVRGFKVG